MLAVLTSRALYEKGITERGLIIHCCTNCFTLEIIQDQCHNFWYKYPVDTQGSFNFMVNLYYARLQRIDEPTQTGLLRFKICNKEEKLTKWPWQDQRPRWTKDTYPPDHMWSNWLIWLDGKWTMDMNNQPPPILVWILNRTQRSIQGSRFICLYLTALSQCSVVTII